MEILALVPARSGSKGIPDKNVREFRGKPLIAHAIDCAKNSGLVSRIVLSTDSPEYLAIGCRYGAEADHLRPAELAGDAVPMIDVIRYEMDRLEERGYVPEAVALLQPTQPLRRPEHIVRAVRLLEEKEADSVVSVIEIPRHFCPGFIMKMEGEYLRFYETVRACRQEVLPMYSRDGTIYLFRTVSFRRYGNIYGDKCVPLLLDATESVMLDEESDWQVLREREDE